ncbi:putative glutamine ABC transporter permease protein GlnM [bioreactor metagenome]|uniref:Putative glutamine ABC transporter permease protein GlnM n=1 Tax=bioreactor metagenome TaxID=1076179 RepID=A0A644YHJ8_9ZZZZ|nr:amino acid ABC transporter permease [Candidatus Metalachnospira sp.]
MVDILRAYSGMLLESLGQTMLLTLLSLIFAFIIGLVFGLMNVSKNKVLNFIGTVYVDAIRGVPLIVLAYFIYFGIPAGIKATGIVGFKLSALQAGTIALSMNAGAYMAEIFRAGIQSVDKGQMEAARSLGLGYGKAMQKVILPQAIRTMVPSIINQFIISLKDTSILSVIGFPELTKAGNIIVGNTFKVLQVWGVVAIMYMIVITILSKVAKRIERRLNVGNER